MITLNLTAQSEKLAPENPWGLSQQPLYHQWRTAQALNDPATHLILNSYNTGSGKTRAALLHLFALDKQKQNVLLVAPTNALLNQHADDTHAFIQQYGLDFQVFNATAATNRLRGQQLVEQGDYLQMRTGESLYRLIRNYREFLPDAQQRQGLVLVVNPDIFYYALMFQYGAHDQRNLFQSFLTSFSYIIIDEFHYYDQKQLAFFLFFFKLSQKMGYFDHAGRKICLLSATPNQPVITYLNQIFGDKWQLISPDNEPHESAAYPTIPALAPLTLMLDNSSLRDWAQANHAQLRQWLNDGQDGAIISDALRRINQLYADLRSPIGAARMGRITGPEPEEARQTATYRPLILATPTVDIGYNFEKAGKQRQNVDFLMCEARYGDDLIQRIGRAGRVLGKPETETPSTAVALLNENALAALQPYAGQTLSRVEFKALIQQHADHLPHKHTLTGYIKSWAVTELFYPIYRADKMVQPDEQPLLEELFQDLMVLFDTRSRKFQSLSAYFRKHYYRQIWLQNTRKTMPFNKETAVHVADWFTFNGMGSEWTTEALLPHLADERVIGTPERQAALRQFVQSQIHLTKSLFNFRDSFQGPTAVIADKDNLFSSESINKYDLFHLVETYNVTWYENRAEFIRLHGDTELEGKHYGRLHRHRDPRLTIELHYTSEQYQEEFQSAYEGRPIALTGLTLRANEQKGDYIPLESAIQNALEGQFLVVLLIPPDMKGWPWRYLRNAPFYGRRLTINFPDRHGVEYTAYLGTAAWLAHAELQIPFKIRDRMKSDAIII
ncbi:MAG: type I-D CRISPR-associated helicase Cas3' [Chloroflexota bacterium]